MRYVRFMSVNELEKFKQGEILINTIDWKGTSKTQSVGFCFFDDSVSPESRIEYLTGVVNLDRVAVFERTDSRSMKKSVGGYRDPKQDMPDKLFEALFKPVVIMEVPEYSITEYSDKTMKLVRAGKVVDTFRRVIEWEDEPCCKK